MTSEPRPPVPTIRFGELLDGGPRNGIYKPKEFHGRGHKIVNMGELFEFPLLRDVAMSRVELNRSEAERFELKPGDLLFARRSLVAEGAGKCSLVCEVAEPTTFESSIIRARPRADKADSRFLYYFFASADGFAALDTIRRQLAVSGITGTDLVTLEMPHPPLATQRSIASVLGTLDDKIELNRKMNRTLEELAAALFKSWFVDFDPVVAKRDGKKAVGVPASALPLFPDHFEDSELGPIPKGWKAGTLGDTALNVRSGISPSEIASGTPYFGLEHLPRCSICLEAWGAVDDVSSGKFQFKQGDFLFGKLRPYFHKVGIAPLDGVCSTDILVVKPRNSDFYGFVLGHISSKEFIDYTDAGSEGTRMPRTNWDIMSQFQVTIPEGKVAEAFNSIVRPVFDELRGNTFESKTLSDLRDALMPALLSGEVTLKTAEKAVEEAV